MPRPSATTLSAAGSIPRLSSRCASCPAISFSVSPRRIVRAGRLDRVRHPPAEFAVLVLFVRREGAQQRAQPVVRHRHVRERPVGRDRAPGGDVVQEFGPPAGPRPLLQLEAELVEFLVEQALGVHVRAQQPPLPAVGVDAGPLRVGDQPARVQPRGEPRDVRRHQQDERLAVHRRQHAGGALLLGVDVGAARGDAPAGERRVRVRRHLIFWSHVLMTFDTSANWSPEILSAVSVSLCQCA